MWPCYTPSAGVAVHNCICCPQVPEDTLAQLLQRFNDEARLEGTYFFAKQDSLLKLANLVERIDNLSLEDRQVLLAVSSELLLAQMHYLGSGQFTQANLPACCSSVPELLMARCWMSCSVLASSVFSCSPACSGSVVDSFADCFEITWLLNRTVHQPHLRADALLPATKQHHSIASLAQGGCRVSPASNTTSHHPHLHADTCPACYSTVPSTSLNWAQVQGVPAPKQQQRTKLTCVQVQVLPGARKCA